jgi:hypothetical protein
LALCLRHGEPPHARAVHGRIATIALRNMTRQRIKFVLPQTMA